MLTEEQVRNAGEEVLVPGVKRSINDLNLIKEVALSDHKVKVTVASAALSNDAQEWIKTKLKESIDKLPEVKGLEIAFADAKPADLNKIDNIIAVMSGKGGVGKSLVAGLTAIALRRQGYEVGVLDADITGPSIPKMFGITGRPTGSDSGFLPVLSRSGINIMSINLLLPSEDEAVI